MSGIPKQGAGKWLPALRHAGLLACNVRVAGEITP